MLDSALCYQPVSTPTGSAARPTITIILWLLNVARVEAADEPAVDARNWYPPQLLGRVFYLMREYDTN